MAEVDQNPTDQQTSAAGADVHLYRLDEGVSRQKIEDRIRIWHEITKHGVAILLLLGLLIAGPVSLSILLATAPKEHLEDVLEFHRTYTGTVAGLAGTALGAYFMTRRRDGHD